MNQKLRKLHIADTTLRDGAQTIGCHFTTEGKLQVAEQLIRLGVDVIELGTPIASPQELETAQLATQKFKDEKVTLSAFARAKEIDIEHAYEGIGTHPDAMLALLTSVSDIHLDSKFRKSREEMLKAFVKQIEYSKQVGFKKVMVYLEDGTRTDFAYVKELVENFAGAGADIISIPDTVGFVNHPQKYGELFSKLIDTVALPEHFMFSAHTHNDKGLAVANALAAVEHGAGQVECTINGLGERAGNASLGALLLNLYTEEAGRWSSNDYGVETNIKLAQYANTAKMVGDLSTMGVNFNEPLMGSAVCTTAAGIHQDGVLKNKKTYFCYAPESYGIDMENRYLSFNMLSGMKGIVAVLNDMGLQLEKALQEKIYEQVILLAQQKAPSIEDIRAIAIDVVSEKDPVVKMRVCKVSSGVSPCTAEVVFKNQRNGRVFRGVGYGDGPFAAFTDIACELLNLDVKILNYHDTVVGEGRDSQMQAYVESEINGTRYTGRGVSTDIVLAGCRAFMKGVNEFLRQNPEHDNEES
jgi:2-isopropylmalate synthase